LTERWRFCHKGVEVKGRIRLEKGLDLIGALSGSITLPRVFGRNELPNVLTISV
jgi:hypothetical protein